MTGPRWRYPGSTDSGDEGYVATTWGWSICIEEHEMAWREDPEKWEADRASPPDPVRMRVLPPDKKPFRTEAR